MARPNRLILLTQVSIYRAKISGRFSFNFGFYLRWTNQKDKSQFAQICLIPGISGMFRRDVFPENSSARKNNQLNTSR